MGRLEQALYYLFPTLRLDPTPWKAIWVQRERRTLLITSRVSLAVVAITFLAHHYWVDVPLGLSPARLWWEYRFGVVAVCALAFGATYLPAVAQGRLYRAPLTLTVLLCCYLQARSMTWYSGVHYVYAILFACLGALVLQTSQLKSTAFILAAYGLEYLAVRDLRFEHPQQVLSSFLTALAVVNVLRARMPADIGSFLAEQQKLQTEKQLIETRLELADQIRSFLPREIYRRVTEHMQSHRFSVLQAMDEALRPTLKPVACVFSDIRGYTVQSRDVNGYVQKSAIPNIRSCTEIVEAQGGVPRLIGDLIFSYFDFDDEAANLFRALRAAMELVEKNRDLNSLLPSMERVKRFVLVSVGEAVVGNIGGFDSSREITALGPPVNILSRIDTLTKDPRLADRLSPEALILTDAAAVASQRLMPELGLVQVSLQELGLAVRDFPDERWLWLLRTGPESRRAIFPPAGCDPAEQTPSRGNEERRRRTA